MTNTNEMVNKMEFIGKTPKCVHCHKLYSMKKMNEEQLANAQATGLCPHCQENEVLMAGAKKAEAKAEVPAKTEVAKAVGPKPGKAIREAFMNLVSNGLINEQTLADFQDKNFILKNAGIKYAFLKKVDSAIILKEQVKVNGKARYSSKPITIDNRQYLVTNDLYAKNVERFFALAESLMAEATKAVSCLKSGKKAFLFL